MRVITGSAKGHGLKTPRHMGLRPTPSRVKEAIFSSLAQRIAGSRVLELFAGTGAFGIETLSRGATEAIFVEKDGRAMGLIEENLRKTRLLDRAKLLRVDVRQGIEWLRRDHARFDLIFADPPYLKTPPPPRGDGPMRRPKAFSWLQLLLRSSSLGEILTPGGVLLIEHFKKETEMESPLFKLVRQFRFGDTTVGVFGNADSAFDEGV